MVSPGAPTTTLVGVWVNTLSSVLLISCVSFVGAFFLPSYAEGKKSKRKQNAEKKEKDSNHVNETSGPDDPEKSRLISFLVALAIGAMLGDAFLHMLPTIFGNSHDHHHENPFTSESGFLGRKPLSYAEDHHEHVHDQPHDHSLDHSHSHDHEHDHAAEDHAHGHAHAHNFQASLLVLLGMFMFFVFERFLRSLHGGPGHSHGHSHTIKENSEKEIHLSGYMNLVADGLHNFFDGLAIASANLAVLNGGPAPSGTLIAIFLHELPQELGDLGVLMDAGFSKKKALLLNFASACIAVLGALMGLMMGHVMEDFAKQMMPVTAGGFIYVAASNMIPELHGNTRPGLLGW
eukprot:CAMPEP_0184656636 /NCGR_PEP_ID=MMETSP0308-20130426/16648_1 /TAXON_ID=38269 /ORGANISM="Gloeochaete witrockiana, Strain SAG 46.84" /LENGTH=346 /DNA_ID=CAMNT_0027093853 /DNA_START=77 /DNA_END=1114 /DNA_ORIENTATION=-